MEQLVARRAHNPKVTGSSPVPATTNPLYVKYSGFFCFGGQFGGRFYVNILCKFLFKWVINSW